VAEDEASLYLQATLKAVWHARGQTPIVRLHPGRESVHFYGALNLATGAETTMRTCLMNAATTALFLLKLLLAYPDQPILLFWDRAPLASRRCHPEDLGRSSAVGDRLFSTGGA